MNTKNDVEVVINGKQYTLCGYESSDYLQRIATHINEKYAQLKQQEGYNRLDVNMRNILLAINLSDDFFKAQKTAQELREQKEETEKEIFHLKHDLLSQKEEVDKLQQRLEESEEALEEMKKSREEAERRIIRLEAEIETGNRNGTAEKPVSGDEPDGREKQEERADGERETKRNINKTVEKRTQKRKKS